MYELKRNDLAQCDPGESLYEAVSALRPYLLQFRGTSPTVALDGVLTGSAARLRDIPVASVERVQLLNGSDATFRYGPRHTGAVLEVTTRRGP